MKQNLPKWHLNEMDEALIDLALKEDLRTPFIDCTTQSILSFKEQESFALAEVYSKEPQEIVFCGLPIVNKIFEKLGNTYSLKINYQDGEKIPSKKIIFTLKDKKINLLQGERILLNFLCHLSGISTLTSKFVNQVKGSSVKILDTRKTTPGFRHLEKHAVFCGGGVNHREGLYDAILIKNNHIDLKGGMKPALEQLSLDTAKKFPVIVEVRSEKEMQDVLTFGKEKVKRVLLDNMDPSLLQNCVRICKGIFDTEASGNITLDNIKAISECGIDYASIGQITHSAKNVDISMKIQKL